MTVLGTGIQRCAARKDQLACQTALNGAYRRRICRVLVGTHITNTKCLPDIGLRASSGARLALVKASFVGVGL